jgi:cobaltochelatase CobT
MRHDIVFKENIDGEALEWASGRLIANRRSKKILIVVSDGAPVDDSTLNDNWPTILTDHAERVASQIASANQIKLGAIGIGYTVDHYYPSSTTAENLSALATVVPTFVEQMVLDAHR